jgi:hypothetical protein
MIQKQQLKVFRPYPVKKNHNYVMDLIKRDADADLLTQEGVV